MVAANLGTALTVHTAHTSDIQHTHTTDIQHSHTTDIQHAHTTDIQHTHTTDIQHAHTTGIQHTHTTDIQHTHTTDDTAETWRLVAANPGAAHTTLIFVLPAALSFSASANLFQCSFPCVIEHTSE